MKRTELKRTKGLRRAKRESKTWFAEFERSVCGLRWDSKVKRYRPARCAMCGVANGLDPHHIVPQQKLRAIAKRLKLSDAERDSLLGDGANGIALCRMDHDKHEWGYCRVPRAKLPREHASWVRALEGRLGTEEISLYMEKTYP